MSMVLLEVFLCVHGPFREVFLCVHGPFPGLSLLSGPFKDLSLCWWSFFQETLCSWSFYRGFSSWSWSLIFFVFVVLF